MLQTGQAKGAGRTPTASLFGNRQSVVYNSRVDCQNVNTRRIIPEFEPKYTEHQSMLQGASSPIFPLMIDLGMN